MARNTHIHGRHATFLTRYIPLCQEAAPQQTSNFNDGRQNVYLNITRGFVLCFGYVDTLRNDEPNALWWEIDYEDIPAADDMPELAEPAATLRDEVIAGLVQVSLQLWLDAVCLLTTLRGFGVGTRTSARKRKLPTAHPRWTRSKSIMLSTLTPCLLSVRSIWMSTKNISRYVIGRFVACRCSTSVWSGAVCTRVQGHLGREGTGRGRGRERIGSVEEEVWWAEEGIRRVMMGGGIWRYKARGS